MADTAAVFGKTPMARQRVPGKDPFQVTQVGLHQAIKKALVLCMACCGTHHAHDTAHSGIGDTPNIQTAQGTSDADAAS